MVALREEVGAIVIGEREVNLCIMRTVDTTPEEILGKKTIPLESRENTMKNIFAFLDGYNIVGLAISCIGIADNYISDEDDYEIGVIQEELSEGWLGYNIVKECHDRYGAHCRALDYYKLKWYSIADNYHATHRFGIEFAEDPVECIFIDSNHNYIITNQTDEYEYDEEYEDVDEKDYINMKDIVIQKRDDDNFEGLSGNQNLTFFEYASAPAMEKRWNKKISELPEDHPAWDLEAYYIAQLLYNRISEISSFSETNPFFIIDGLVGGYKPMLPMIRKYLKDILDNSDVENWEDKQILDITDESIEYLYPVICTIKAEDLPAYSALVYITNLY